jgi:hypothetical protein
MFSLVVKLVCKLHIQIFADGIYLVDLHIQVGVERWYDMQLVVVELGQQYVELHDPNKMWVNCNLEVIVTDSLKYEFKLQVQMVSCQVIQEQHKHSDIIELIR